MRQFHRLDEAEALVHEQHPCLLRVEVLHLGVHEVVYSLRRSHVGAVGSLACGASLAQLARRQNGDGLRLSDAVICRQLTQLHLAERIKIAVAVADDALHELHGALLRRS